MRYAKSHRPRFEVLLPAVRLRPRRGVAARRHRQPGHLDAEQPDPGPGPRVPRHRLRPTRPRLQRHAARRLHLRRHGRGFCRPPRGPRPEAGVPAWSQLRRRRRPARGGAVPRQGRWRRPLRPVLPRLAPPGGRHQPLGGLVRVPGAVPPFRPGGHSRQLVRRQQCPATDRHASAGAPGRAGAGGRRRRRGPAGAAGVHDLRAGRAAGRRPDRGSHRLRPPAGRRPVRRTIAVHEHLSLSGATPGRLHGRPRPRVQAPGPRGERAGVRRTGPETPSPNERRPDVTLQGKVGVVTGAASGIGRALCRELAREGVHLGLLDRDAGGLQSLADELSAAGVRCARAVCDVRRRAEVRSAFVSLAEQLGPADLLVACAGITGTTLVDDLAVEETEAMLQVNVLGVAYAIDAVLPSMLARRGGHIVGVSSLAGCRGMPFAAGYSASKAALGNYLESLRPPLRKRGIAVTTVLPGFVRTPLVENAKLRVPLPMIEPEEAARFILQAIRRRRRVFAFPWGTSLTLGVLGWLPPGVYDWLMARGAAKVPDVVY